MHDKSTDKTNHYQMLLKSSVSFTFLSVRPNKQSTAIRRYTYFAYPTTPREVRKNLGKEQLIDKLIDSDKRLQKSNQGLSLVQQRNFRLTIVWKRATLNLCTGHCQVTMQLSFGNQCLHLEGVVSEKEFCYRSLQKSSRLRMANAVQHDRIRIFSWIE